MGNEIQAVSIVGAGNVATHLGMSLAENGIKVLSVSSKSQASAEVLAQKLKSTVVQDLEKLPPVDLVLVCVSDDQVSDVMKQVPGALPVAYTAGSVQLDALPERENTGVFYPLQTFSKSRQVNMFEVPFLIEAKDPVFTQSLFDLAWKLSRKVQFASSEERKKLHLGAVMINNFTNHMAYLAKSYLDQHQLDWELLKPLMGETFEKLRSVSPYEAQTGPARRNDQHTISEHISMLEGLPQEIYAVISRSIEETYNSGNKQ